MNKLFKTSVLLAAFAPAIALAQATTGDREITLSGVGSSDKEFEFNTFSLQGSYGQYLNDMGMWGIRQQVGVADAEGESANFDGATVFFYDHHFGQDRARPFVGANLGYNYGETTDETFSGGLELGLKYYVLDKTFIQGMAQYQFLFDSADDADDNFDDGAFYYSVGMGYNF